MRIVVATVLMLVIFFIGAHYMDQYINKSSEVVTDILEGLEEAIKKEDWETAQQSMMETNEEWTKTKKVWLTFLEHNEIDKIDIGLAKLQSYVNSEEKVEGLSITAELRFLFKHIVEKQAFKLTNVL